MFIRGSRQCLFYSSNDKQCTRLVCYNYNYVGIYVINVQLCVKLRVGWHQERPAYLDRDLVYTNSEKVHILKVSLVRAIGNLMGSMEISLGMGILMGNTNTDIHWNSSYSLEYWSGWISYGVWEIQWGKGFPMAIGFQRRDLKNSPEKLWLWTKTALLLVVL